MIAVSVVIFSMLIGTTLGVVAGYYERLLGAFIMRAADVIMSFPSLLLAVIVLYVLEPAAANVVIVLAITRLPIYIRVARAEVLEIRERLFVESARASGASNIRIMVLHILPVVVPTIFTVATLDFAGVMLSESGLSFLGIGVQPPDVTWGLMVAMGRNFLTTAWWLAFWPGLAILLTALATNLLSNWLRLAMDPMLRWRLEDTDAVEERRDV
jgi:peptide/nickel transport system permease protein